MIKKERVAELPEDYTIEGLVSGASLKTAALERSKKVERKKVSSDQRNLEDLKNDGWTVRNGKKMDIQQ